MPTTPVYSGVPVTPAAPTLPTLPAPSETPTTQSQIEVKVPAGAQFFVDGQAVSLDNGNTFRTPTLQSGRQYYYTMKVEAQRDGEKVMRSERVIVAAGRTVRVDFTDLSKAIPVKETQKPSEPKPAPATIKVSLPADAKLFVDDVVCPLTSELRSFNTPALQPGQRYGYTLRAEIVRDGKTISKVRQVEMQAGSQVNVKFEDMESVQAVSR
jgi:uncharacterized protein (TIGR03000 family)